MSIAVITGASRGIGLELARQLKAKGFEVFAACRKPSSALQELQTTIVEGVDVASDEGIGRLVAALAGKTIDVLINNAGILTSEELGDLNIDRIRKQFEVNSLGPLRVTAALTEGFAKGSKVAIVTSRMGSITDNTSGSRYGYRMSKAAVNMAGVSLAHDLKERGIAVAIVHPGFVRTEMTNQQGFIDPPQAAQGILERIEELTLQTSGTFWHSNGETLPW
jgi:NAD(P)-dependent dehydrogenase (short-subunit alcohol dehydrogenase family)